MKRGLLYALPVNVVLVAAASAFGAVPDAVFSIQATTATNTGIIEINSDDGNWRDGSFFWSTSEPIPITSGNTVLGTFGPAQIEITWDRRVVMAFGVRAGSGEVEISLPMLYMSFPTMARVLAQADVAVSLLDVFDPGAALVGHVTIELGQQVFEVDVNLTAPPGGVAAGTYGYPEGEGYALVRQISSASMDMVVTLSAYDLITGSAMLEVLPVSLGDLNCDTAVNAFDIDAFVLALTDPSAYGTAHPYCDYMLADINGDGLVNAFDIDPFVLLLTGG